MDEGKVQRGLRIVFERRPFLQNLILGYAFFLVPAYFAIIATASNLDFDPLQTWLALWSPLADFVLSVFPQLANIEQNISRTPASKIPVLLHFHAIGWLVAVVCTTVVTYFAFANQREGIRLFASRERRDRLVATVVLMLVPVGMILVAFVWFPQYVGISRHFFSEWNFVVSATVIGGVYYVLGLCTGMLIVTVAALIEQRRFPRGED